MHDAEDWRLATKGERFLYAILNEFGACWVVRDGTTEKAEGLPALIREGWRPVRETPFVSHKMSPTYILICLERD